MIFVGCTPLIQAPKFDSSNKGERDVRGWGDAEYSAMDATADGSTAWLGDKDGAVEAVDTRQGPDSKPAQVPGLPGMLFLFVCVLFVVQPCSICGLWPEQCLPRLPCFQQVSRQANLRHLPACVGESPQCQDDVFIWSPGVVVSADFSSGPSFLKTRLPHLTIGMREQFVMVLYDQRLMRWEGGVVRRRCRCVPRRLTRFTWSRSRNACWPWRAATAAWRCGTFASWAPRPNPSPPLCTPTPARAPSLRPMVCRPVHPLHPILPSVPPDPPAPCLCTACLCALHHQTEHLRQCCALMDDINDALFAETPFACVHQMSCNTYYPALLAGRCHELLV